MRLLAGDGLVALGHGEANGGSVVGIVLLHGVLGVANGHGGDVRAVDQNLVSHLAAGSADVVVADGDGSQAAAGAHTLLTADHGDAGRLADTADNGHIGSGSVVGGDVQGVSTLHGSGGNRLDVVGVGEGEDLGGNAGSIHAGDELVSLQHGVGLGGAVQDGDLLDIGNQLHDTVGVQLGGNTVGGAGDIHARPPQPERRHSR